MSLETLNGINRRTLDEIRTLLFMFVDNDAIVDMTPDIEKIISKATYDAYAEGNKKKH